MTPTYRPYCALAGPPFHPSTPPFFSPLRHFFLRLPWRRLQRRFAGAFRNRSRGLVRLLAGSFFSFFPLLCERVNEILFVTFLDLPSCFGLRGYRQSPLVFRRSTIGRISLLVPFPFQLFAGEFPAPGVRICHLVIFFAKQYLTGCFFFFFFFFSFF